MGDVFAVEMLRFFRVDDILTKLQGLGPSDSHALPWYPPVCDNGVLPDDNSSISKWMDSIPVLATQFKFQSPKLPDMDVHQVKKYMFLPAAPGALLRAP